MRFCVLLRFAGRCSMPGLPQRPPGCPGGCKGPWLQVWPSPTPGAPMLLLTCPCDPTTSRSCSEPTDGASPGTGPSPLLCVLQPLHSRRAGRCFGCCKQCWREVLQHFLTVQGWTSQQWFFDIHFLLVLS